MADAAFHPLLQALDRFAAAGRMATLWWRDDDAAAPSPALDRLLALAGAHGVPVAIAVVPALCGAGLAERLQNEGADVAVLQHGYAHQNHAAPGERKIELGPQRPAQVVIGELATGWLRLESLFGERALPVLVPPWNRMAPFLVPVLPELGYRGLSQFGPRLRSMPAPQLVQVNCHVDPIDWRGARGFAGDAAAIAALCAHLGQRLAADAASPAATEPTGLMSHHAVQDEAGLRFIDRLLAVTKSHLAVRWIGAREAFGR